MHFRLPKPLHGWRAFAGEVGIIVVGVLIALAFEQMAQSFHNRAVASEAREAIRAEVRENLFWIEVRERYEPCVERALSELDEVLRRARNGQSTPRITNVGLGVHSKITSLRWNANAQAGRASLFSGDEQRVFGNMYFTTEQFSVSQEQEETAWAKMGFLEGIGQLTDLDVHELSLLLAEARYRNLRAQLSIERSHQWANRLSLTAANPNGVENLTFPKTLTCPRLTEAPLR